MMYQERDWSKGTPRILVIDDERTFKFPATYARTLPEALWLLCTREWDEVWLDHDMGDPIHEMMQLVNWMEQLILSGDPTDSWQPHMGTIVIHSSNPVGRERMKAALENWYNVRMVRAEDYF